MVVQAIQKERSKARTNFKVTTCLYLNPNNRARSLSTLIAPIVSMETAVRIVKVRAAMLAECTQRLNKLSSPNPINVK